MRPNATEVGGNKKTNGSNSQVNSADADLDHQRRTFLKLTAGTAAAGAVGAVTSGSALAQDQGSARGTIEMIGYGGYDKPEEGGIFTQGSVRDDGEYAVCGGYFGTQGSTLFDLSDLENPEIVHRLESPTDHRQNGIKFLEATDGIYIRSLEPNVGDSDLITQGFQVVDYGWGDATAENPEVIAEIELPGGVHKLDTHPEEPIVYTTGAPSPHQTYIVDVSDPENPEEVGRIGPDAGNHAPWVDADRGFLYSALIGGPQAGFAIHDISDDPADPELVTYVDTSEYPDYETGNFETAGHVGSHFVSPDPERDLLIVGDEIGGDHPGAKKIWDIGWGDGTPENPEPLGFTYSPNAEIQDGNEPFFWTTHMHAVVPESATSDGSTILVDGGYHEGVWAADITDPENPQPAHQYLTREDYESANEDGPVIGFLDSVHAPNVWSVEYNAERDFLFASDMITGGYTLNVTDDVFEFYDPVESFRKTFGDTDEITTEELQIALHYWGGGGEGPPSHEYIPNTGRQPMTTGVLRDVVSEWRS
jgi:hypothetical protein